MKKRNKDKSTAPNFAVSQRPVSTTQSKTPRPVFEDPHNILLTEKEAAEYLKWTVRSLQQRRYFSLPPIYIKLPASSAVRYRLSDLMAFVQAGEIPLPL